LFFVDPDRAREYGVAWLSVAGTFRILAIHWSARPPAARPVFRMVPARAAGHMMGAVMAERARAAGTTIAAGSARSVTAGRMSNNKQDQHGYAVGT
jgi:hypothetical protein